MKKIIYYIIVVLLAVGFWSCEDELDQMPISDKSTGGFFKTVSDFEQAVNGVYASLSSYPERQFHLSDVRSDNVYGVGQSGVRPHEPVNNFSLSLATNDYIEEAWETNYIGIKDANVVLDRISTDIVTDEATYKHMIGQVKFLRALYYFDLIRYFGAVPLIDVPVTIDESLEIPRSPVTDIYTLIISDLEAAIDQLPESWTGSNVGRATSYAAKALLAKVYLTRSGVKLNANGPCLGSDEYGKALTLLNEVIAGPFITLDNYADIFDLENENNDEIVFDVQFKSGGLDLGASYPGLLTGSGYWAEAGVPFAIGLETKDISFDLINSYGDNTDLRFDFNVSMGYIDASSGRFVEDPDCVKFSKKDPKTWGEDRFDFPINFPVIRLTDVLLMKAEAILSGATGSQQEVDDIVNTIRTRAGLDSLSNVTMDQMLEERRKEFLGEGTRWHVLVRTGKVLEVMNAWIPVEDIRDQMLKDITSDHLIYPIPQSELDVKSGLYQQNIGYN